MEEKIEVTPNTTPVQDSDDYSFPLRYNGRDLNSWYAFYMNVRSMFNESYSRWMEYESISASEEGVFIKGRLHVNLSTKTSGEQDESSSDDPIPLPEVPVVEVSAHPKGAQSDESQPQ